MELEFFRPCPACGLLLAFWHIWFREGSMVCRPCGAKIRFAGLSQWWLLAGYVPSAMVIGGMDAWVIAAEFPRLIGVVIMGLVVAAVCAAYWWVAVSFFTLVKADLRR